MSNTVVGFFKNRSEAEDAVSQLTNSGFDIDDIDVSYGRSDESGTTETSGYDNDRDGDHHKGNAISRFFNSLFGDDSDDARKYTEAGSRADSIVTVHATSTVRAEEAANILDASGAVDIDEGSLTDQTYATTAQGSSDLGTMNYTGNTSSDGSVSTGLTDNDLREAGITGSYISDAEAETAKYSSDDLVHTGGTAPGITGAPTTGDFTTAGEPDEFINRNVSPNPGNAMAYEDETDAELRRREQASDDLNTWTTPGTGDTTTNLSGAGARDFSDADDYTKAGSHDDLSGTNYAEKLREELRSNSDNSQKIDVVREDLHVGKRTVETGGVRVRSRIIEKPVEQHLRLREETVRLHREPVNRPATADEIKTFKDMEIELTERAEVPVVNKEARVVEEISVTREVNERDETIRDTVRETRVDIDDDTNRGDNQRS